MKKLFCAAVALALAAATSACSPTQNAALNTQLVQTTQNLVALNNALVQVNATLVNNAIAQAKVFAPYACGGYALAAQIVNDSNAAASVNAFVSKNVAAGLATVAVKDVCAALGYGASVTAAPASSVPAVVSGS